MSDAWDDLLNGLNEPDPTEQFNQLVELKETRDTLARLVLETELQFLGGSLYEFMKAGWHVLEPEHPFTEAWHIETICDHLHAVTAGDIKKLVINIPPRHLKSLTVEVFWPAWHWTKLPGTKWLCVSYGRALVVRDAMKTRRLVQSNWYQKRWGHVLQLAEDQQAKSYFETTAGGYRMANSIESGVTGEGGDILVVDDPTQLSDAENQSALERVIELWDGVLSTRLNDPVNGARVIIMQRLNERDLTGHVLKEQGWTHLYLPTEYEPKRKCVTFLPKDLDYEGKPLPEAQPFFWDPRTQEGELLCPQRYPAVEVQNLKMKGDLYFASQQQQRPVPATGGIFKVAWLRYYDRLPEDLEYFNDGCISLDCSFKDLKTSSYVVLTAWARKYATIYLLHLIRRQLDLPGTIRALKEMANMFPWIGPKLVEDRANGSAVISMLKGEMPGLIEVNPEGGKESRAAAVSYMFQAGNVLLPEEGTKAWMSEYKHELTTFPRSAYSDQVDSTTQALAWYHGRRPNEIPLIELLQSGSEPVEVPREVF